ncbi:MAG: hypothetical protein GF416_05285 [Candidatus Altiarchaeales archaeon]|nr:hypothetical protein [Candidatus Altiarchaeales archaeon]MBD3416530.1 hypothetical protein [Candidatus Altiarchaeales archaeon]
MTTVSKERVVSLQLRDRSLIDTAEIRIDQDRNVRLDITGTEGLEPQIMRFGDNANSREIWSALPEPARDELGRAIAKAEQSYRGGVPGLELEQYGTKAVGRWISGGGNSQIGLSVMTDSKMVESE